MGRYNLYCNYYITIKTPINLAEKVDKQALRAAGGLSISLLTVGYNLHYDIDDVASMILFRNNMLKVIEIGGWFYRIQSKITPEVSSSNLIYVLKAVRDIKTLVKLTFSIRFILLT